MSKILITGGAGYIGSLAARKFLEDGYEVRVLDNFLYGSRDNLEQIRDDIEIFEGDIRNIEDTKKAVEGVDKVLHLAAISSIPLCSKDPDLAIDTNIKGTKNVLEACLDKNIEKILYANGAAGIYGKIVETPVTEKHPAKPVSSYGVTKYGGELFMSAYYETHGLPTITFRQSNVYGPSPGMKINSVIQIFVNKCLKNEKIEIFGSGNQIRNFIFIEDLIDAYKKALESNVKGEVFNVGGFENISINDLAELIVKVTGSNTEISHKEMNREEIENLGFKLSFEKAEKMFGFKPKHSLEEGIRKLVEYMKNG